jgi:hypothetical protein
MTTTKTLIIMAAILLLAASCSIKEDRSPCPCWLSIDLNRCTPKSVTVAAWGEDEIFCERVAVQDYQEEGSYEKTVPKGYVSTSVIGGERDMQRSGARLIIPMGHDADSIYAHARSVECFGEFARDTAVLHKQFARVFMSVQIPQGHQYPYTFKACSDICGMDMRDLSPVEGDFLLDLKLDEQNICMFCIPRQKEDGGELRLLIYEEEKVIETIPLADWIDRMGYNWLKKDLEDIYIGVDYAKAEVSISIKGWDDGVSFKVEI